MIKTNNQEYLLVEDFITFVTEPKIGPILYNKFWFLPSLTFTAKPVVIPAPL